MRRHCSARVPLAAATLAWTLGRPPEIPFTKHALDLGANESCALADLDGDGRLDIISGENWYAAPKWTQHRFRTISFSNHYVDNFSDLPLDVNADGQVDIVSCAWFSRKLAWFENPGRAKGEWKEHPVETGSPVEFAFLVDLDNDGKAREVLPQFGDSKMPLKWYEVAKGGLLSHTVSAKSWGHGIGAGDVNGDGRNDILTPKGWFEAPADPRAGDWKHHPDFDLGATGFIHVLDVNGDGRNDLAASMAHDYGVFWMERGQDGAWTRRVIDDSWSQAHALTVADLNGDGRKDLITGKRYMAHNGRDPGEREPLGIYWYEHLMLGGKLEWVKHVVDYGSRSGGGMQIPVADIDGDGDPDFAAAGKSGLFLFENLSRKK
ncbi:MAG: VCBS repeat-containing protein [Acidobacteria bacterium]|nr:VCBS repeat-containing protein [Acidobacteriota bacterium]